MVHRDSVFRALTLKHQILGMKTRKLHKITWLPYTSIYITIIYNQIVRRLQTSCIYTGLYDHIIQRMVVRYWQLKK